MTCTKSHCNPFSSFDETTVKLNKKCVLWVRFTKIHCNPFSGFGETGVRQLYSVFYIHIYVDFVFILVNHYNNSLVSQSN